MSPTMRLLLVCAVAALATNKGEMGDDTALMKTLNDMVARTNAKLAKNQKEKTELQDECASYALDNELDTKNAVEDRDRFARKEEEHSDASDAAMHKKQDFSAQLAQCEQDIDDEQYNARKAKEAYNKQKKDYDDSIFAMDQATSILEKKARNMAQAAGLLQQQGSGVHGALAQFLHKKVVAAVAAIQQPQANVDAYKTTLGPILEMIADMHAKISEQLKNLVTGEMKREHAFNMAIQDLNGEKERLESAIAKQTRVANQNASKSADNGQKKGLKNKEIDDLKDAMSKKQMYCDTTVSELTEQIKLLTATSANQAKAVAALKSKSFLMLLQTDSTNDPVKRKALMSLLVREATDIKSSNIAMIAASAQGSPFDKVLGMITDMIARLEQEAADEAGFKEKCDKDIKNNAIARKGTQGDLDTLNASQDENRGNLGSQNKQKSNSEKSKADTQKAMSDANKERAELKEDNEDTIAKYTAYKGKIDAAMGHFQKALATSSNTNSASAVVSVLKDLGSKFQNTVSNAKSAEAKQTSAHEGFISKSESNIDDLDGDLHEVAKGISDTNWQIRRTKKKIGATSTELGKIQDEGDDLQQLCNATPISYEERAAKREAEIKALEEGYAILNEKE